MLLFSMIGPIKYVPAGTSTVPPPLPAVQSSIAFCTAAVSFVVPSPLAPYFFTSHTLPAAITGTDAIPITTAADTINRTPATILIASPRTDTDSAITASGEPGARADAQQL